MAAVPEETVTTRHDAWRALLRSQFVSLDVDVERDSGSFGGTVRTGTLGHLKVSSVRSVDQDISRTDTLLRRDRQRYFQVGLMRQGEARVRQDGHEALLRPGDFVIYETERPFHWWLRAGNDSPHWDLAVFTWPRDTIELRTGESAALTSQVLSGSSGLTGVVGRMLADLLTTGPTVGDAAGIRVADEIGQLVATAAAETCGAGTNQDRDAELLRRIDAYLDENLADPELSATRIAQAHFLSTRQLQRLFARRGQTVSGVIRRRRLERCRRELLTRRGSKATLAELCLRWGFTDPAVFSRAFRDAYGTPPSTYRALADS